MEKSKLENEKKILLNKSGYHFHTGTSSFFVGFFWWMALLLCLTMVINFIWELELSMRATIIISLIFGTIMGLLDSETVSRNRIVTIEHRFYKNAICNFSEGRHWTRFFLYKVNEEYDSTPFEITVDIDETASNSDSTAADDKDKSPVPIKAKIRIQLQLFDALSSEDIRGDGDDDLETIDTEATDVIESYIREHTLSALENSSGNEIEVWIKANKSQFIETIRIAGYLLRKIDIINLGPTEQYWKSRVIKAEKLNEAEGKKVDSDAREVRIDKAIEHFIKNGFSKEEAIILAEARIDKQDGYKTIILYEGLENSNAQPMVPLKK